MKNNETKKRRCALSLRPGAIVYAVLFVYSLILTQLLRNPISAVFFWFMLICLPVSFLIMIIGRAVIQIYVFTDKTSAEKLSPVKYEIRIINPSPLPLPFADADITMPGEDGVRCSRQRLILSLPPFGGYSVKTDVAFRYRGLYEIGVSEIYIYDPLRIFRIRRHIDNYSNVTVSPRALDIDGSFERADTDSPSPVSQQTETRERTEMSNIREYRAGDTLKSIHWKLSSKNEELQVRDFSRSIDRHTYIFADLAAPTPPPDTKTGKKEPRGAKKEKKVKKNASLRGGSDEGKEKNSEIMSLVNEMIEEESLISRLKNTFGTGDKDNTAGEPDTLKRLSDLTGSAHADEPTAAKELSGEDSPYDDWGGEPLSDFAGELPEYCADGVAEIALSAAMKEIRMGNKCTVAWYDGRDGIKARFSDIGSTSDLVSLAYRLTTAPVVDSDKKVSELCSVINESVNITVKIVTSNIDPVSAEEYCSLPNAFGGAGSGCSAEVLLFDPVEKYASPALRSRYTDSVYLELSRHGVKMSNMKKRTDAAGNIHLYDAAV